MEQDYIVIGAGSAGCVVARRLSDAGHRVLLLEAGPESDAFWVRTPAGMARLFKSERYNWRFHTEPVQTLNNRRLYWPRGKGLGGSSAINGMVYIRGNRRDYDGWARLGNTGWGWDGVLPYFIRAEDNSRGPSATRGVGGPLAVSDPSVRHPALEAFIEAAHRTGIPRLADINDVEEEGAGLLQASIRNGRRQSAYDAFVAPVRHRSNLSVLTRAHVRRLVFDGHTAVGCQVLQDGHMRTIRAAREVILCAGALASPHLLMLSGIGDGAHLQAHSIPPLVHLPGVGRNLQDHFTSRLQMRTTRQSSYNRDITGWRAYLQGARYLMTGGGYLAMASSQAAVLMKSGPWVDYADLEVSFRPMTFSFKGDGLAVDPYHAVSASLFRVRPASRGEVLLRSADPMVAPAFVPNYLQHSEDEQAMIEGFKRLRTIFASEPMASHVVGELEPGSNVRSDDQLIAFMKREGTCSYHPAGSCKMGIDEMAVVDPQLRVRGVKGLRVIDASIMPVVTSGNTNAPTIMIGEKGADMVLSAARL